MTPEQREEAIRQAKRADEVAEFIPFEAAKAMIYRDWAAAKTVEEREALHAELHGLARVQSRVQAAINIGRQALNEKTAEQVSVNG